MKVSSTILIVDDEPIAQEVLGTLLLPLNYNLAFASHGAEALAKAVKLVPDLILLDIMMPVMNGLEVCRHLRAHSLLAEVPIIMVTALDDRDSRVQGIEAGADDFISKPFDRVELRARVRTIIRLNRYRRLLAERAKLEWVVEQADDGYLMVSESDEILYSNPKAHLYLGLLAEKHKPIAKTFLELARQQYRCEPQEAWAHWPSLSAADLQRSRYLMRPESTTANAFWLQVNMLNIPAPPDASRLIRLREVTTQMALRRDMWSFHAMISHKLRTPLSSMLMSLQAQVQFASTLSRDEIAQVSQVAIESVQRLHDGIEDILQYLNAPTLARHGTGFHLSRLRSMVVEISDDLGLKSVSVSDSEGLDNARILFSQPAIELALREVLENAKKFHPRQAPRVEISASFASDKEAIIKIADDGLSLSPQQLAQLQTPYYQAEKQMTGQVTGMGLGMAMVASLIWEAGGTCRVYNREPGPGLVVELILPLAPREANL